MAILKGDWGTSNARSDVDHDGLVGMLDLNLLLSTWSGGDRNCEPPTIRASFSLALQPGSGKFLATAPDLTEIASLNGPTQRGHISWAAISGELRISASAAATQGSTTINVKGVGCQSSDCGRPFELAVTVTLTPLGAPEGQALTDFTDPSPDRVSVATPLPADAGQQLKDEVAVTLGTTRAPGTRSQADGVAAAVEAVVVGGVEEIGVYQLRWATPQDIPARVAQLRALPEVTGVDLGILLNSAQTATSPVEPSDWNDDGLDGTWHLRQIRAPQAWALSQGTSTVVGIVDDGQVSGHQDLGTIQRTGGVAAEDHPTHVAGLACAKQNGIGLVGAAWGCPLISDSVSSANQVAVALLSAIPAATRVVKAGAKVVNMSLGYNPSSRNCVDQSTHESIVQFLTEQNGGTSAAFRRLATGLGKDVVFTLSAGNACAPSVYSPYGAAADLPNVITVASVNQDGHLSSFSNWGAEVAAGGGVANPEVGNDGGVWSTLPGNRYGQMSGTSMAAPLVAGVAALVRSANSSLSAAQVGDCITSTAGKSGDGPGSATLRDDRLPKGIAPPRPDGWRVKISYTGSIPIVDAVEAVTCAVTDPPTPRSDSLGTDFWLAFPLNYNQTPELSLFISSPTTTTGTVSIPGLSFSEDFTVAPGTVTTVQIPAQAQLADGSAGVPQNLGIRIRAAEEVAVYGLNRIQYTTDAFRALPLDVLGTKHLVLSWPAPSWQSEFAVVATQDGTDVTYVPTAPTTAGVSAGVARTVTLNAGQALPVSTKSGDLSGTEVTSTKPVALIAGHQCANIPSTMYGYCDHLLEQIPATRTWGNSFSVVPLQTRLGGDTLRVLAAEDNTTVTINGSYAASLDAGELHQQLIRGLASVSADKPILVAQYSHGSTFDGVTSDPFMTLITANDQLLSEYTFATPATGFRANFVNVVTTNDAIGSIKLDGALVPASAFTQIGSSGYSGAQIAINAGSHTMTSGRPFGITVYGFDADDSYGYPGGSAF